MLLTGGGGQLGRALRRNAPAAWSLAAPGSSELDIADAEAVRAAVAARPWTAVINAAAFTEVDRAEDETEAAWRCNAEGPARLAAATSAQGIPLVQLSTDYVFDGRKRGPYVEDDPLGPISVYGASKAAGEGAVREGNPRHVILRTAWLVSPDRSNFIKTMFRLADAGRPLRVVGDQMGSPTSADDVARALIVLVERIALGDDAPVGVYHFVNRGGASRAELARAALAARARHGLAAPQVAAVATSDYPTRARRPANSQLSTEKFERAFGLTPRPWRAAIAEVVDALVRQAA